MTEKLKLKECCEVITDGDHLPPPKATHGIPFITISNINANNEISFDDTMYVPIEYYDGLSETKKAKSEDVLLSVVGSFGKPVYIEKDEKFTFQRHIALLRHNNKVDGRFLYYTLLNPQFYKTLDKLAIGCSQRTVTLDTLRNIEIDVPRLDIQRKIVDCLSAIDEKIKINNSINNNLSNQICTLYDYWFVQFDFPNNNKLPYRINRGRFVYNSQLKLNIPEEWEVIKISDITKITWGQCPDGTHILDKSTDKANTFDYCSGAGDMKGGFVVDCQAKTDDSRRFANCGDILLSIAGKIGDMCVVDHRISLGRAAMAFTCNNKGEEVFVYSVLKNFNKKITTISSGSIQKVINKDHIDELFLPYNKEIVAEFCRTMSPLYNAIIDNTLENRKLTAFRDWLLPMLMNGQANIDD